jgi:hypothetical protein
MEATSNFGTFRTEGEAAFCGAATILGGNIAAKTTAAALQERTNFAPVKSGIA